MKNERSNLKHFFKEIQADYSTQNNNFLPNIQKQVLTCIANIVHHVKL